MIRIFHYADSEEDLPSDWEVAIPKLKEGAEEYKEWLIADDKARQEWESEHDSLYFQKYYPIPDDLSFIENLQNFHQKKHKMICLEKLLGERMFKEWKWNTPEVQSDYTKSKTAGADFYKQYESNPDLADDVLTNLRDRTNYMNEAKKIEMGVKHGKYENN